MQKLTIKELSEQLNSKKISSLELTNWYLKRIEALDPQINSYITLTKESALEQAKASDERRQRGEALSPLDGIPMAHKDIFCTKNVRTTAGSKMLANFIPSYDAFIVSQLNNQGAVMLGKVSMDEFAMGASNEHSYFGAVKNPHDLNRVPGGSSGGSAAAVAGGLAVYSTGSDTGGSIRQPAAYCGISGIKPTYGTLSRYGMIAYASSFDQAGVLARSAEDLALVLNGMAGHDLRDSTAAPQALKRFDGDLNNDLRGIKIGIPKQYFAQLNSEMAQAVMSAAQEYEKLGAQLVEIDLHTEAAIAAYYIIASAEASSNLERYDGVRYGYRAQNVHDMEELYRKSRSEALGSEVKRRIMIGTYALSAGYYDAYYEQACRARNYILQQFAGAFSQVDVILSPTTTGVAYPLGSKVNNPVEMFLGDLYTVGVNLAGLPALSHPCAFLENLPVGCQLIAPHFKENLLLNLAHKFQENSDFHLKIAQP